MNEEDIPRTVKLGDELVSADTLPTPLLIILMLKWRGGGIGQVTLAREMQERHARGEQIGGYALARANREHPPPCACGQKGTRIVGRVTYCGKPACLQSGIARLKARDKHYSARATDINTHRGHLDGADRIHALRRSRNKRKHPK
jgi:hypothetical protein